MTLLARSFLAFTFGITGASALQFADYAEALDQSTFNRAAADEPADINLGDCVGGHADPSWPAPYRAICTDLAANAARVETDNDKLETASLTPAQTTRPAPLPHNATCTIDMRGATTLNRQGHARFLPPALATRKSSNQRQSGIALLVEPACTVQSPVSGKVLYAGDFKGYRGIIIVRMKTGHQLIIAGLDHLDVTRGQSLARGTNIGATSQSRAPALATAYGSSTDKNSLLYFDLRNAKGDGVTADWLPQAG